MAKRRIGREWAVQFLFQNDFNPGHLERELQAFWKQQNVAERNRSFAEELISGVLEHREELDVRIRRYADNWDIHRLNAVDRNVLRLALYEMLHRPDIPPVVSINEAVDLAKRFSSNESGSFVNGILDRASQDLLRPRREPAETP